MDGQGIIGCGYSRFNRWRRRANVVSNVTDIRQSRRRHTVVRWKRQPFASVHLLERFFNEFQALREEWRQVWILVSQRFALWILSVAQVVQELGDDIGKQPLLIVRQLPLAIRHSSCPSLMPKHAPTL
jgi:hypothetical protein